MPKNRWLLLAGALAFCAGVLAGMFERDIPEDPVLTIHKDPKGISRIMPDELTAMPFSADCPEDWVIGFHTEIEGAACMEPPQF